MDINEKKEEPIKVLNEAEEQLEENQLESVEGGNVDCTCDCWISNSNSAAPSKSESKPETPPSTSTN